MFPVLRRFALHHASNDNRESTPRDIFIFGNTYDPLNPAYQALTEFSSLEPAINLVRQEIVQMGSTLLLCILVWISEIRGDLVSTSFVANYRTREAFSSVATVISKFDEETRITVPCEAGAIGTGFFVHSGGLGQGWFGWCVFRVPLKLE